jgi:hypothetical protein
MAKILRVLSWTGLLLTIVPPAFAFLGMVDGGALKVLMFAGAISWFAGRVPATWKQ